MSKQLSQEAEARLLGAIEKTAVLVNDGMQPDDAIVKAASEDGIPPGHVSLLVHAYNTGRTTRQRHEGEDVFEKSADFDLADTASVLEKLYNTHVKTASQKERETAVSVEYALPPSGLIARRELREKQAINVDWKLTDVPAPAPYPRDPAYLIKKAYCDADRIKREIDESRRVKASAFGKMGSTFMELTDYFRSPTSIPLPVVREQASLLHGGKATQLIDQLTAYTPGLLKLSHNQVKPDPSALEPAIGEPYALVSQFLDELDLYKQASAAHAVIEKSGSDRQEALLRPFDPRPRSVLDDSPFSTTEKTAGVQSFVDTAAKASLGASLWDRLAGGVKAPDESKLLQNNLTSMTDPDHEARLRQIHTTAILQDLMLNDPVISSYDPTESTGAFNDIVEASPRSANQKLMLQSLMRQRLEQGHLDPFAIDQAVGTDNKLQNRDSLNMPKPTPGGSNGGSVLG